MRHRRATALGAILLVAVAAPTPFRAAYVDAAQPEASAFRPVSPCRLLDTRADGTMSLDGTPIAVGVRGHCGVSQDASAVALTITAVDTSAPGFLTLWPHGVDEPLVSSLNFEAHAIRSNSAIVAVGSDGMLSLSASVPTDAVLDVTGEFDPAVTAAAGRYIAVAPSRVLDTRDGVALEAGSVVAVSTAPSVPDDAVAAVVEVTVDGNAEPGFVTAMPGGQPVPLAGAVTMDAAGETRSTTQIVPLNIASLALYTSTRTDLAVDLLGYFTGPSAADATEGLFVPMTPGRMLDTRESGRLYPGGTVQFPVMSAAGTDASVLAADVTVTETGAQGGVSVYGAGASPPPHPQAVWDRRWQTAATFSFVPITTAGLVATSATGTHLVVDVFGRFLGLPPAAGPFVASDVAPPAPTATGPAGCVPATTRRARTGLFEFKPGATTLWEFSDAVGPKGPVVVLGDSLTRQSALLTVRGLQAAGWGPICLDGKVGRTIVSMFDPFSGAGEAIRIRRSNPLWSATDVTWVIALGTNETTSRGLTAATASALVATELRAVGGHVVWWVNVQSARRNTQGREAIWNDALVAAHVRVVDWSAVSRGRPFFGADQLHLVGAGVRARVALVAGIPAP